MPVIEKIGTRSSHSGLPGFLLTIAHRHGSEVLFYLILFIFIYFFIEQGTRIAKHTLENTVIFYCSFLQSRWGKR